MYVKIAAAIPIFAIRGPAAAFASLSFVAIADRASAPYTVQAGCALVARLLATARVFEIAVKAGYVSC